MITRQIKTQIDQIWNTFWTGGMTSSITILEQMTHLFFTKMLASNMSDKSDQSDQSDKSDWSDWSDSEKKGAPQ